MAQEQGRVSTALGEPITIGKLKDVAVELGKPPVVLQVQAHAYIPLDRPEQLEQFEADLRKFYGISMDGAELRGHACETCSCGCSDDCGLM